MNGSSSTIKRLITVWPLLFGIGMLTTSNGLQATLLGLRAGIENFPVEITGIIMAMYYAGFLVGCRFVPSLISSVGHIRVFAALTSLASITVLLHGVFVNPWVWIPVRLLTGFCLSGLFIITESWLNKISNKEHRGTIFSAYVSIVYGGQFAGQFLINLAPLTQIDLFILVSVLVSVALTPITLTNKRTPGYQKPESIGFRAMITISPLAMAGVFIAGISLGTVLALGPVYTGMLHLPKSEIAFFMGTYILGSAALPMVLGPLSDKIDRRKVIVLTASIAAACGTLLTLYGHYYILIFLLGGMTTSLYSVSMTHVYDQVKSSQIVSASRSLILFNAAGSMAGPILGGVILGRFGAEVFFAIVVVYMLILIVFALYRIITMQTIVHKRHFIHLPIISAPSVLKLKEKPPVHEKNKNKSGDA